MGKGREGKRLEREGRGKIGSNEKKGRKEIRGACLHMLSRSPQVPILVTPLQLSVKFCRPIYVTRYRIDSYRQSKTLSRQVASEMFLPCAGHIEDRPVMCIWHFFKSELFLFILHISTLIFGVVKASNTRSPAVAEKEPIVK